jgi:rhodanese-related sulfurtransferase
MNKGLIASVTALALILTGCASSNSATNLDAQAFAKKITEPGVTLIDVRTPGEFAAGHIEGAINIDIEGMQFDSDIAKLDKGAQYAIYCQSGRRSVNAANTMSEAGFTNLLNLSNGIASWSSQGLPVTTS